jgi:glycosyltransferase involved in cell wall biosynthesis
LAALQPDVVHANSLKAIVYATVAVWGTSTPLVIHVRDRWAPPYMSRGVRGVLRMIARLRSDLVIANSSSTGDELPGRVELVPSPVASEFFAVPAPLSSPLTIAVIGRFAPWKGQDFAVRVATKLHSGVSWRWIFIGDALFGEEEFREHVERAASASPCADRFAFYGDVVDVAAQLALVDIVVLTSQSPEPFGNVITEAMAAGRAVVVPNEGGPTEFVEPERSGLWYIARDADSCAQAVNRLLENDDLRLGLGRMAAQRAVAFGAPQVATRVETLYDEVLGV